MVSTVLLEIQEPAAFRGPPAIPGFKGLLDQRARLEMRVSLDRRVWMV